MPKLTGADVAELDLLAELTSSAGWRVIKNILNAHRIDLVERAHRHLEKHEDRKAGELLACSKEPNKILSLIKARKDELSTLQEQAKGE